MKYYVHDFIEINIDKNLTKAISYINELYLKKISEGRNLTSINVLPIDNFATNAVYIPNQSGVLNKKFFIIDENDNKGFINVKEIYKKEVNIYIEPKYNETYLFHYIIEPIIRTQLIYYHDCFLLHASAFSYKGKSYVLPAWGGTGKTNLLLGMLEKGAKFYSDDLVIIDRNRTMYSYPRLLNLFNYNVDIFPRIKKSLGFSYKVKSILVETVNIISKLKFNNIITKVFNILNKYSKSVTNIKVDVSKLFAIEKNSIIELNSSVDYCINLISSDNLRPELIDGSKDISNQMSACHYNEWGLFINYLIMNDYLLGDTSFKNFLDIQNREEKLMRNFFEKTKFYEFKLPLKGVHSKEILDECIDMLQNIKE